MPRVKQQIIDVSELLYIDDCNSTDVWSAGTDTSTIATSNTKKTGSSSLSFDKDGTTVTTGSVNKVINGLDARRFALEFIGMSVNFTSATNVTSVTLRIGDSAANSNDYTVTTTFKSGWNDLYFNSDNPTTVNGTGVDWTSIDYLEVIVTFGATGNTLTDILVDSIRFIKGDSNELSATLARQGYYAVNGALTGNATVNVLANLGRPAVTGSIVNTHSTDDFTFDIDGATPKILMEAGDVYSLDGHIVNEINLIHDGTDSSYQITLQ